LKQAGGGNGCQQWPSSKQLNKVYGWYTGGFLTFVIMLAILEQMGLPAMDRLHLPARHRGAVCRHRHHEPHHDAAEYYVAGRRVPAIYNGMATGADWMSAASFIGMAGTLYLTGYGGLAFIMGWTGGYCLVALFLAPYLRKFGQFTIPDFLGARYEGNLPRFIGILAAILCSFTYVVAQIYGVGLITTRLSGLAFEIGIFVGLGGILVCSFLGGMRAVTWTQVAQYIILIIAYMIPVVWLSVKQTSVPIRRPSTATSCRRSRPREAADRPTRRSSKSSPSSRPAPTRFAAKLKDVAGSAGRRQGRRAEKKVDDLKAANAPADIQAAEKALAACPRTRPPPRRPGRAKAAAAKACQAAGGMPRTHPVSRATRTATRRPRRPSTKVRRNFLALVFCLMVGTAALPHILMRYYTTPSGEGGARVGDLVAVLHLPAVLHGAGPGGAGQVRGLQRAGGHAVRQAAGLDRQLEAGRPGLLSVADINKDGIFQLGEMKIGGDIIVLATPEIGACPTWCRAWWRPAAWRRRCPPPTACC
jgi:cation/acetate symporter